MSWRAALPAEVRSEITCAGLRAEFEPRHSPRALAARPDRITSLTCFRAIRRNTQMRIFTLSSLAVGRGVWLVGGISPVLVFFHLFGKKTPTRSQVQQAGANLAIGRSMRTMQGVLRELPVLNKTLLHGQQGKRWTHGMLTSPMQGRRVTPSCSVHCEYKIVSGAAPVLGHSRHVAVPHTGCARHIPFVPCGSTP